MSASPSLEFRTDPGEFVAVAGAHLAAEPVINTVVATEAYRSQTRRAERVAPADPADRRGWWLVVRADSGAVVGAGMRTGRYPPYLLSMPDTAAVAVARTLHGRGEQVLKINGVLPAVERCATELARLGGGRVEVAQHSRLHELGELSAPAAVPGRLVQATEHDLDLVAEWFEAFDGDAAEQAGRPRDASPHDAPDRAELLGRIRAGGFWFWLDERGERVHLTGANPPALGVARVGPVYTPPAQRGRGWASNAVAEVSRRIRARGARVCLFTDQANPTSNRIYAALGYRPVADMANLLIVG
ncbi:GNAT family N-acetyltransferase [Plantactinospora siamensis]|uniref:GNAT family N-acetyltransferase n=1 Tax=Plantactinospora siamensis TaxID=555372 RepID=A0ABV6P8N1_9ACTN